MNDLPGVQLWPDPSTRSPVWFLYFALFMLAAAMILSLLRHRRKIREHAEKAWNMARRVAEKRGLDDQEWATFSALVHRWAPDDPLGAISRRILFEEILDADADARVDEPMPNLEKDGKLLSAVRFQLGFAKLNLNEPLRSTREMDVGQSVIMSAGPGRRGVVRAVNPLFFNIETHGTTPLVEHGERVAFRISREEDARYEFTTVFLGLAHATGEMIFLNCAHIHRMQDRANDRVPYHRCAVVDILPPERNVTDDQRVLLETDAWGQMKTEFIDISAVGVAMKAELSLPASVLIRFRLELDSGEPLRLVAQVVDSTPTDDDLHIVRVQYVHLGPMAKSKLVRYVRYRRERRIAPPSLD